MASDESQSKSTSLFDRLLRRNGRSDAKPDGETADTQAIVDSAAAFKSLRVADLMTPRADVVAVEVTTPFNDLLAKFVESEHSRMPIYRETLDDPLGVIHVKDVFRLVADEAKRPAPDATVLNRLKRELFYVPPSMPASALLAKMQASRVHMALVIDEFGGADGLVTLEDLVEAVVGEIDDEHDEAAGVGVVTKGPGLFEVDARVSLEDVSEAIGVDLTRPDVEEEVDTIGGLVSTLAGRVPQRGEVIAHPDGYDFEVIEADPRRLRRLRIRLTRLLDPPET